MNKRKLVRFSIGLLNILVVLLLIWSIVNYQFLNKEVSNLVQVWGLIAMIIFIIILEGAPVFVGPSVVVAATLATDTFNPGLILFLFLVSAVIGNILYYFLGYFSGEKILKYLKKKDVKKYKKVFKKYGRIAMITMAISPIPYLPTIAGVFRLKSFYLISETLILRLLRHGVVFMIWFLIIKRF